MIFGDPNYHIFYFLRLFSYVRDGWSSTMVRRSYRVSAYADNKPLPKGAWSCSCDRFSPRNAMLDRCLATMED